MRVASIGYATSQGLGHLMHSFWQAGVITDPIIYLHSHPSRQNHRDWYPLNTPATRSRNFLRDPTVIQALEGVETDGRSCCGIDILLAFETFFDWNVVNYCRGKGTKTVLIPMGEWTPVRWPAKPDALICPSLLDRDMFKDEFPGACPFIPVPVDPSTWKLREKANRFLHNAGNIGHREHKGTRQLLEAVKYVKNPNFHLTIRAQDARAMQSIINETNVLLDSRVDYMPGEIPYEKLWDGYDVYIAPEKLNGLSLPLQEARAAGLLVITTDRYPANTWLPRESLILPDRFEKVRISGGYREIDEAIVNPLDIAETIDRWVGQDISSYSKTGYTWAHENSWEALKSRYLDALTAIKGGKPCN